MVPSVGESEENTKADFLKNGTVGKIPFPRISLLQARFLLGFVSILCFTCSWDGEFVFDDSEAVVGNKDLDPSQPLSSLLIHDFWGKKLTNTSHKSYRPLTVLTFRWNYWIGGGLHPEGFHLVNIVLHAIISILLLDMFTLILYGPCPSQDFQQPTRNGHQRYKISTPDHIVDPLTFLCSLLFAVHPVHTESVAGIVGRADLLCALFFILSFLSYVKGSTFYGHIQPVSFSFNWLLLSALFCVLATFSKEQGITVIGVCCAFDVLSICRVDLGQLFGLRSSSNCHSSTIHASMLSQSSFHNSSKNCNGTSVKNKNSSSLPEWTQSLLKRFLFLFVSAVVLLVVRWRIMGSSPPTFQVHDNPQSFVDGIVYRILNYNYIYTINSWILLSPQWLCFDWSMGCVPTITSLTDPRIIAVLAFWLIVGLLAWACLIGLDVERARPLALGIVLLVVPFLPATNLFFRVGFVVAERVLYLPSVGFCVIICQGVRALCRWPTLKMKVIVCFALLVGLLTARCMQRSLHWKSEMVLFSEGEKVCPLNAKIHYNIGKLNGDLGNTDIAVERYRLAIELNPVYDQAMNNLANILKDQGNLIEAESLLDKAVEITPTFSSGWMNRGITKAALGKYEDAEISYLKAIKLRRKYPDCYYNLGNLLLEMKRHQEALHAFRNATTLKPTHWNSWNNAVILLDSLGHYDQAIKLGLEAIKYIPDHPSILYSLGNAYGKTADYQNSEKMFLRALKFDQNNVALYQNLGVLYHRWNKYTKAQEFYEKAYAIKPDNPNLLDNMNMLKKLMNQGS